MGLSLQTSVKAIGLSNRTTNALVNNGINTVQQLLDLSFIELFSLPGLGANAIEEIQEVRKILERRTEGEDISYTFGEYWRKIQPDVRNFKLLLDYYNSDKKMTLQQLGDKYSITKERTRQLLKKGTERINEAFSNGIIDKKTLSMLEKYADDRTEIHMLNISDEDFTGIGIANLVTSFNSTDYKIFTNRNLNGEWLIKADDHVEKLLDTLMDELKYAEDPLLISTIENLYSISENMLMSMNGVIEKDGYVTHKRNKVVTGTDKNRLIYAFLDEIGRPVSVNEIVENTNLKEQPIRVVLSDKSTYVNVGKSVYDLIDRDYHDKSIDEIAKNLLVAEDRAIKIDKVVEYVQRYKDDDETFISLDILRSPKFRQEEGFLLLENWSSDKIKRREINNYYVTLEDAVLEIINSSDEIFDYEKVAKKLEKYGDKVSRNLNSIKATLIRLSDKRLINRIAGPRSGCYARNKDYLNSNVSTAVLRTMVSLGSFINANIGRNIEIRYKTNRKKSDKYWRTINVRGQDGKYIYTNNLNDYGYPIKYSKDKVVDYRKYSGDESKQSNNEQLRFNFDNEVNKNNDNKTNNVNESRNSWYNDVYERVKKLGNIFTLNEMYQYEELLSELHPSNNNIRAKIRQQLQLLRDDGIISVLKPGIYQKVISKTIPQNEKNIKMEAQDTNNNHSEYESAISHLEIGKEYNNDTLAETFLVSKQGGMRRSHRTNSLVLIAKHENDNPYDDKWDGDHFECTGMGLAGDQSINYMQNKTLAESKTNGVDVYLFESYERNKYVYRGRVELDGEPHYEIQKDENGTNRKVVKFPLKLVK